MIEVSNNKNKIQFINFLSSSLNNNGYFVNDKLESLYSRLKFIMNKNNMTLKENIDDDLMYLKFCYFVYTNLE